MKKKSLPDQEIIKLFTTKQKSAAELAEKYRVSIPTIYSRLRKANLTRKQSKPRKSLPIPQYLKSTTPRPAASDAKQEGIQLKLTEHEREDLIHYLYNFIHLPFPVGGCDGSLKLSMVWLRRQSHIQVKKDRRSQQSEGVNAYGGKCDCDLYISLIQGRHLS